MNRKPVYGLTGGIASGKSTVGRLFADLGVLVIDADQLAREIVVPGSEGLRLIIDQFGVDYLSEDGTLNRAKLGLLVFSDKQALETLNGIMHPRIHQLFLTRCQEAKITPYILYESALLVETGQYRDMDGLVVVSATPELQLARVMKRNQLTESQAQDRLASQFPLEKKLEVADLVILNDNDREALMGRVRKTHKKLIERTFNFS